MPKSVAIFSIFILVLTGFWLLYAFSIEFVRWQFLTVGGVHFICSIIVNKQLILKDHNYLGYLHTILCVMFFGIGYIAM